VGGVFWIALQEAELFAWFDLESFTEIVFHESSANLFTC
jgi:hypothetical protein